MKKLIVLSLLVAVVGLSGCGDKDAREYAAKLGTVLDSYQEQLSQKIKAEQTSYEELAAAYEEARKADIDIRLAGEREKRSEDLGEKVAKSKDAPTLSQLFASLQEYGKLDFETTQTVLQETIDARSKYLDNLESLELELQNVKLLKAALQELAKGKSDFAKFKGAGEFLLATDGEINKQVCTDLKKQLDQLTKDKGTASSDKDKKKIDEKIKKTSERLATKKCS
jgi:outer membrane murein-binding lipoprotein Lpp